jgi:hypothetical protein
VFTSFLSLSCGYAHSSAAVFSVFGFDRQVGTYKIELLLM